MSYLETGKLSLLDTANWTDTNDSHFTDQYAKAKGSEKTYALCFTMASETFHHWDIFAQGVSGVCIEFDREKLLSNLISIKEIRHEDIKYKKIYDLKNNRDINNNNLPFIKRVGYEDEHEYRLIVATNKTQTGRYDIDVPLETIRHIRTSPRLSSDAHDHVKASVLRIKGAEELKIYRSTLISNENWKRTGQTVALTRQ